MNAPATFQELILALQTHWSGLGCVLLPGWDRPVGAGTLAPHTAMRLIGDKPFKCAYVQPCRRPLDVRDKTHTQRHHQFQVMIKPAPENPLELFAAVWPCTKFDFKKDTWESPILGASGKGWEASVNGLEVAQITVFKRIGRRICEPALEIAYGLERVAMIEQGVSTIPEIRWDANHLYEDVCPSANEASVEHYDGNCSQIRNLNQELKNRLSKHQNSRGLAFYENILEVSHLINLLDARGALAVEAKTWYIRRACDLMEQLVVGEFGEVEAQPFHQIYHPKIGLTHKRDARIEELAEWWGRSIVRHLERLVGLWGVGERATGSGDPYRLEESAAKFGGFDVKELSLAIERTADLHQHNEHFSRDSLDELKTFIIDASAESRKPKNKGAK